MRVRQRKVIENDVLHSWLVDQLIQSYGPGLDVRNFGCDDVHAVKLLKVSTNAEALNIIVLTATVSQIATRWYFTRINSRFCKLCGCHLNQPMYITV